VKGGGRKDIGKQGMGEWVEEDYNWQDEAKEEDRKKERHMYWTQKNIRGQYSAIDEGG